MGRIGAPLSDRASPHLACHTSFEGNQPKAVPIPLRQSPSGRSFKVRDIHAAPAESTVNAGGVTHSRSKHAAEEGAKGVGGAFGLERAQQCVSLRFTVGRTVMVFIRSIQIAPSTTDDTLGNGA